MVIRTDPQRMGKAPPFDLCAGHPALDFVNSLADRFSDRAGVEGLQSYADLLRFTQETRLLEPALVRQLERTVAPGAAARALRAGRALREALAAALHGLVDARPPPSAALETLDRCFHAADAHRELRWEARSGEPAGLAWAWGRNEGNAELPVWVLARAALELTSSREMQRVRACEADTCRWLFLDTSKNHSRRWCKMEVCGNRMKARRFQARHSE